MKSTTTATDKRVAAQLGLTVQGLKSLARQEAQHKPINDVIGSALFRRGLVDRDGMATAAGKEVVAKARAMGW